ncbi:hypothetical protein CRUP_033239 [Coryphaenoides rupestris]|nr:hypothetical protein CRUP_033239 [Coryphaenoides rupestris]
MLGIGSTHDQLQTELTTVLERTVDGMEKLSGFLDALEKLASTSLHLFTCGDEVLKLSLGVRLQRVEDSISAARLVCPLLLRFKRDAGAFFFPSLHNVDVIVAELDKYICTAEKICTTMEKRMDPHFRLVYLFQEKSVSGFIDKFCEHHPRMLQVLNDIEDSAIQLDNMKFGSNISKVAGNSLGAIGGALATVGLALAPVTAGLSLGLTAVGAGLGITSAVNTAVTTVTEITVNTVQQKKASEGIQGLLQDMKSIQDCLDEKLASTSLLMFTGGDEVLKLSLHGISLQSVADSISVARLFKRDAGAFFRPSLHNVAVFVTELDRYIHTTEKLCTIVEKS